MKRSDNSTNNGLPAVGLRGSWRCILVTLIVFLFAIVIDPRASQAVSADEPLKEKVASGKVNKGANVSKISLKKALVLGDKKAPKKVIVFTDPDCSYCGVLHEELKQVVSKRNDIVFFIRLFPLIQLHPDSYWKSKSIVCSQSMQMLEDNFLKKPIYRDECDTKEVDNTMKLAGQLKISSTPTMIFSDGSTQSGAMRADDLIRVIDGKYKK